jgi:hypothetical protein
MIRSFLGRLFSRPLSVVSKLSSYNEGDNYFTVGARSWASEERDRFDYDREEMLKLSLEAWRVNPLARRIVELTTQYVVGAGLRIRADHARAEIAAETHEFIGEWWNHRLNQVPMRAYEWCDELTRSGELFFLVSTDAAGMSYVRAVPAADIESIQTADNDVQQELAYVQRAANPGEAPVTWRAYDPRDDAQAADGSYPTVMVHYAINRPVGAVRGESDLAPLLRWLSRYAAWLEDRARLNRYRNSFLFVVRGRWASEAERASRQAALSAVPPSPGSFLVVDESETWEVVNPQLESADANEDGLALKKMIAAGAGLPLHFLAEPESSTRSTAESAGGPTYRHFEQRQEFFTWLVTDLARVCVRRRGLVYHAVRDDVQIQVTGADLSARDNAALAVAMSAGIGALAELRDRLIIDDAELLRMAFKLGGETPDVEALLARGRKAGRRLSSDPGRRTGKKPGPAGASKIVDPETGEAKGVG